MDGADRRAWETSAVPVNLSTSASGGCGQANQSVVHQPVRRCESHAGTERALRAGPCESTESERGTLRANLSERQPSPGLRPGDWATVERDVRMRTSLWMATVNRTQRATDQGWDEGLARSSHEGVPKHQVYRTKPAENRRQLTGCPTPTRLMWPRVRKRPRVHELTSEAVPDVGVGDDGVSEVRQVVGKPGRDSSVHEDGKVGVATCTHASTCPRADQVTGPGRRGRCRRSLWGAPGSTGR